MYYAHLKIVNLNLLYLNKSTLEMTNWDKTKHRMLVCRN